MGEELQEMKLEEIDGKWYVISANGKKLSRPYDTREESLKRLRQIKGIEKGKRR